MLTLYTANIKNLYLKTHVQYFANLFQTCGYNLTYDNSRGYSGLSFGLSFDHGQNIYEVCFADVPNTRGFLRYHSLEVRGSFVPISFMDWNLPDVNYTCNSDVVINRQRIYGSGAALRLRVQAILSHRFDTHIAIIDQNAFFNEVNNCLVAVFVPGACANMLDRAQLQYMFLGCCTISPYIPEALPNGRFVPGLHYVECRSDFADIVDRVNWVGANRGRAVEIGARARQKLLAIATPQKLVDYVRDLI